MKHIRILFAILFFASAAQAAVNVTGAFQPKNAAFDQLAQFENIGTTNGANYSLYYGVDASGANLNQDVLNEILIGAADQFLRVNGGANGYSWDTLDDTDMDFAGWTGVDSITTVGTIGAGTWEGTIIDHERGGLGIDISAIADGDFIVGTGAGTLGLESGATARDSIGLGTADAVQFTTIGCDTITLTANSDITLSGTGHITSGSEGFVIGAEDIVEAELKELTEWLDDVALGSSGALTIPTGQNFLIGTTQWNSADEIDGTKIKDADYGHIDVSAGGAWTVDPDESITVAGATVTAPILLDAISNNYAITTRLAGDTFVIQAQDAGSAWTEMFGASGTGENVGFRTYGYVGGTWPDLTDSTWCQWGWTAGGGHYEIETGKTGDGPSTSLYLVPNLNLILNPDGYVDIHSDWTASGETCADLGTVTTADINGGTIDGTVIGGGTPAAGTFTTVTTTDTIHIDADNKYLNIGDTATDLQLYSDGTDGFIKASGTLTLTDGVEGDLTLSELSCPPLVMATEAIIAEESYSHLALTASKVLIKWIEIVTTSPNWTFTVYDDDDEPGANARTLMSNQNGNVNIYWDFPYIDTDASDEFHYTFTDNSGTAVHTITVSGTKGR